MKSVTFTRENGNVIVLTKKSLGDMTGSALVELHNEVIRKLNSGKTVARFADKDSAVTRTWKILGDLPAPVEQAPEVEVIKVSKPKVEATPNAVGTLLKAAVAVKAKAFRGTNLASDDHKAPRPCRQGSKQAALVDLLQTEGGVSMEQLIAGLAFGKKPWIEATVRSGFGWDLKQKGYGVQSFVDEEGVERFSLVVTPGYSVPAHTPLRGKARAVSEAKARQTSLFDLTTE